MTYTQWSLNTVNNIGHETYRTAQTCCCTISLHVHTWSEFDTEWLSCPQHGIAHGHAGCLLIHLDCRLVGINPDDLCAKSANTQRTHAALRTSHKLVVPDADELVHGCAGHSTLR